MLHDRQRIRDRAEEAIFGSAESQLMLPKYRIPQNASRGEAILEMLRDELFLDGNARQNLATFCQTYADEEVRELMDLCIDKNMIDKDEYPQTAEIESRCVHMLADLWNAPLAGNPVGTSTVGSSEACMLGGLAMYFRWKHARRQAGKPTHRPNLVTGPVQVCWEKFARYWDIELRQVPMDPGRLAITPEAMPLPLKWAAMASWWPPWASPSPGPMSRWRTSAAPWTRSSRRRAGTCPSTWTGPPGDSWPPSAPRTWPGTSETPG